VNSGIAKRDGEGDKNGGGVNFNKLEFLKLLSHVLNNQFVEFCLQRKGAALSTTLLL